MLAARAQLSVRGIGKIESGEIAALELYRRCGNQTGQAHIHTSYSYMRERQGRLRDALEHTERARDLYRAAGHHTEAVSCFRQALELFRDLGNRWEEAVVLTHFGDAYDAAGDLESADTAWREGLVILEQLNHPDTEPLRTKLRNHLS